jgi:hypothetical protein
VTLPFISLFLLLSFKEMLRIGELLVPTPSTNARPTLYGARNKFERDTALGVNQGVNILRRDQILPLGANMCC